MRIRPNLLAAGAGLTVLLAVGVPAVAYAESGSTSSPSTPTAAATCPGHAGPPGRRRLPGRASRRRRGGREAPRPAEDQRAAARKAYLAQHPDVREGPAGRA